MTYTTESEIVKNFNIAISQINVNNTINVIKTRNESLKIDFFIFI